MMCKTTQPRPGALEVLGSGFGGFLGSRDSQNLRDSGLLRMFFLLAAVGGLEIRVRVVGLLGL